MPELGICIQIFVVLAGVEVRIALSKKKQIPKLSRKYILRPSTSLVQEIMMLFSIVVNRYM